MLHSSETDVDYLKSRFSSGYSLRRSVGNLAGRVPLPPPSFSLCQFSVIALLNLPSAWHHHPLDNHSSQRWREQVENVRSNANSYWVSLADSLVLFVNFFHSDALTSRLTDTGCENLACILPLGNPSRPLFF